MERRGKNKAKLDFVMAHLIQEEPLPASYHEHPLHGDWEGTMDCHIEPDWLLLYEIDDESPVKTVNFRRTGTHADLF